MRIIMFFLCVYIYIYIYLYIWIYTPYITCDFNSTYLNMCLWYISVSYTLNTSYKVCLWRVYAYVFVFVYYILLISQPDDWFYSPTIPCHLCDLCDWCIWGILLGLDLVMWFYLVMCVLIWWNCENVTPVSAKVCIVSVMNCIVTKSRCICSYNFSAQPFVG